LKILSVEALTGQTSNNLMSQRKRYAFATILASLILSFLAGQLGSRDNGAEGWLYDTALWARANIFPSDRASDKVVVVALDQRSLDSAELRALPRALFAPVWAELLNGLGEAGARAIAFDFLFTYSGGQFKSGYDRTFQQALYRHRDRTVLGRSAATLPAKPFLAALRFELSALGMLELIPDQDGVIREFPLVFDEVDGDTHKSLSARALERAGIMPLPANTLPAPRRHPETLATYAMVDLLRCLRTAPETLSTVFKGRMVFIGSVLADEDRRLGAARYLTPETAARSSAVEGCNLPPLNSSNPNSQTVPGVFLHAMAAQAVVDGDRVELVGPQIRGLIAALLGGVGVMLGLFLAPWSAFALAFTLAGSAWGAEVVAIEMGLWLPALMPILALFLSTVLTYLVRYLVEERRRKAIQNAFGHYLAPSVVDGLMENPDALRLGGTLRNVSVMFADLSGFTALSTRTEPAELFALTNHYLAIIADEVDDSGGYVDKFIGDAVMAIWGAPTPSHDHPIIAVRTALGVIDKIAAAGREAEARGAPSFGIKIGIHSGQAIVGNVGSDGRYNYTAVGETVNIAARLEGLPGVYGCKLLLGPTTGAMVGEQILLREIDLVAVKGRAEPLTIYEPIASLAEATATQRERSDKYGEALAHYRARRFDQAAEKWFALGGNDGPAKVMAHRAKAYSESPPSEDWDGVFVMSGK
jgi:adenylate cyclase